MYCKKCGTEIDTEICPNCGTKNTTSQKTPDTAPLRSTSSARATEKIIYECTIVDDKNRNPRSIVITPQRVTIGSATYSTANITSVSIAERPANRLWGILIALFGFFGIIIGLNLETIEVMVFSFVLLLIGIIVAASAKGKAYLAIVTAAGQIPALWSQDRAMIRRLVQHIETAIIERG
jgi:hypothetical protein